MIETLIFDYGGVITSTKRSECFCDWASAKFGLPKKSVRQYFRGDHFNEYLRGKISKWEFFAELKGIGVDADVDSMVSRFVSCNRPEPMMVNLLNYLSRRYDLCLISDSTRELTEDVKRRFPQVFRIGIFSDEQGCIKDDKILYDVALGQIGTTPDKCLYVDDREDKLEYPRSRGVLCIHFKDVRSFIGELSNACVEDMSALAGVVHRKN